MQYTNTYQFALFGPADPFRRAEINGNAQKAENALLALEAQLEASLLAAQNALDADITALQQQVSARTRLSVGTYTGNGADSRTISLGFTPRFVAVCDDEGTMRSGNYLYGGIAITGHPAEGVEITTNGFVVKNISGNNTLCNYSSSSYTRSYLYYAFS